MEQRGNRGIATISGREAVDLLHGLERQPTAIIASYRQHEGHAGVKAICDIHAVCAARIPVVVLTGDKAPEHRSAGKRLPPRHKPITATVRREALGIAA